MSWTQMLLTSIRRHLAILPCNEEERELIEGGGWMDVWIQATCFWWWVWIGPRKARISWYEEIKLRGMTQGTRRELLQHVFRPREMNFARAARFYPRDPERARVIPGTRLLLVHNRRS